jgi:hypothetical protein
VRHTHALLARLMHHEHASLALAQRCSALPKRTPLFTALLNYRTARGREAGQAVEAGQPGDGIEVLGEGAHQLSVRRCRWTTWAKALS